MEKLHEYKRFGFSLTVYQNRISIVDKSGGMKGFAAPKETDILIKNITGINIRGLTRSLELTMMTARSGKYRFSGRTQKRYGRSFLNLSRQSAM